MKYILTQEKDYKFMEIKKELIKYGVKLIASGSSIKMPLLIMHYFLKYGRPAAIIYRYLNDYPSFAKTIARTLSEMLGIILSMIINTKIIWICHNIDRETDMHFPKITKFRRWILKSVSSKIMVTDPLLIPYAQRQFPKQKSKIDYITFGEKTKREKSNDNSSEEVVRKIKEFFEYHIQRNIDSKFGFVAGHISWKTSQYEKIPELINIAEEFGHFVRFIVIGPIGSYLRKNNKSLYQEFKNSDKILFLDGYYPLDMDKISNFIHFYWRVYLDLSIPATIYESTYYKKPILTQNKGFLGQAVSAYSIGYVVNNDYSNLPTILSELPEWDSRNCEIFIKTHTWKIASKKLFNAIEEC